MGKQIIKNKMTYSESKYYLSFAINSASDFDSASGSDSDSESDLKFSFYESRHLYFLYSMFAFF